MIRLEDIDPAERELELTVGMPEQVAIGFILARRKTYPLVRWSQLFEHYIQPRFSTP